MIKKVLGWILLAPYRWWTYRWESYKEEEEQKINKRKMIEEWEAKRKKRPYCKSKYCDLKQIQVEASGFKDYVWKCPVCGTMYKIGMKEKKSKEEWNKSFKTYMEKQAETRRLNEITRRKFNCMEPSNGDTIPYKEYKKVIDEEQYHGEFISGISETTG